MGRNSASLISDWRKSGGLSQAALARAAGVPASTVRRIEIGEMEPTVLMLQRIAEGASRELVLNDKPMGKDQPSLAVHFERFQQRRQVDWTSLRSLMDYLSRHHDDVASAIKQAPNASLKLDRANLCAGIAEKLADDHLGGVRPNWTGWIPPRPAPWEPTGTLRMQALQRKDAPAQFSRRGIWVSARNVWREVDD